MALCKVVIHDLQVYEMIVDLRGEDDPFVHRDIIMDLLAWDRGKYWKDGEEWIVEITPIKDKQEREVEITR